jgi:hypothetical protein
MGNYVANSAAAPRPYPLGSSVVGVALALGVFVHDAYLRSKPEVTTRTWNPVRVCTLICTATALLSSIIDIANAATTFSAATSTVLRVTLATGLLTFVAKVCDLFLCFDRYRTLYNLDDGRNLRLSWTFAGVATVLGTCSCLPTTLYYTLLPFLFNVKVNPHPRERTIILDVEITLYVLFQIAFTILIYRRLLEITTDSGMWTSSIKSKLQAIAWRAIGHSIFSAIGIVLFYSVPALKDGMFRKQVFIFVGLHVFLNFNTVRLRSCL